MLQTLPHPYFDVRYDDGVHLLGLLHSRVDGACPGQARAARADDDRPCAAVTPEECLDLVGYRVAASGIAKCDLTPFDALTVFLKVGVNDRHSCTVAPGYFRLDRRNTFDFLRGFLQS